MTPREFHLKLEGWQEKEAWKAIINKRANQEKKVSIDILLGRKKDNSTTPEQTNKVIYGLENIFGKEKVAI